MPGPRQSGPQLKTTLGGLENRDGTNADMAASVRCVRHPSLGRSRSDEGPVAWIDRNVGISLFEDDRPLLHLDDKDNDGSYDWLNYDVYNTGSSDYISVLDGDLDGQADSRTEHIKGEKPRAWLWFEGAWRPIKWLDAPNPNQILVDGVWRRYERVDGVLALMDDE